MSAKEKTAQTEGKTETQVRFKLPEYVTPTSDEFDGQQIEITYDSNYGGDVTVSGEAKIDEPTWPGAWNHLVVDGRYVRSNGHVFNGDERHLGRVESISVTVPHDAAVDMITENVSADVNRHDDRTIIQTWDRSVMNERGFMEGTDEFVLEHTK